MTEAPVRLSRESAKLINNSGGNAQLWYVTAEHKILRRRRLGVQEVPYRTGHLKQLGSSTTACGLPAFLWPTLWGVRVRDVEDMCRTCLLAAFSDGDVMGPDAARAQRR